MKQSFKLSKSNILYFISASILYTLFMLAIKSESFSLSYHIGSLLAMFIIPTIVSWLAWRSGGKKVNGGSVAFNVVFSVVCLSLLNTFLKKKSKTQESLTQFQEAKAVFKEQAISNPDSIVARYYEFSDVANSSVETLMNESSGEEKEFVRLIKTYFDKLNSHNHAWLKSLESISDTSFLNASFMNNEDQFQEQKEIAKTYIAASKKMKTIILERVDFFQNQSVISKNNEFYQGFMKGFMKKDSVQRPIFERSIDAHIGAGEAYLQMIEVLHKEKGHWIFEDGFIEFEDSESNQQYSDNYDAAAKHEEVINELYDKLIEVM